MTASDWLTLTAVCCLGAASPGPSLAVVLRHTVSHSTRHGVAAALAHAVGVGIYAGLTVTGLGVVYQHSAQLRTVISVAGAAYLIYLAVRAWLSADGALSTNHDIAGPRESIADAARDGFLIAFLNPKIAIFFLALFSQFLTVEQGWASRGGMALLASGIDGVWYVLVAIALSHTRVLAFLRRHAHTVNRTTAVVLCLIALRVLWELLVAVR